MNFTGIEDACIWSDCERRYYAMDIIVSSYGCMFLVGVLGNGSLGIALCSGPGARKRSPLLLGLVAADFFVCCLSGPITAALYTITSWHHLWRRVAYFLQAWPVSASTLSMMAISMERYLTVKNYRPAGQVVRRRDFLVSAVVATWFFAAVLSAFSTQGQSNFTTGWSNSSRKTLLLIAAVFVYIVPTCAVLISHLGIHSKLTALSLTARAKHGELPLPMPLLRRPSHQVIIVAGISSKARKMGTEGEATTAVVAASDTDVLDDEQDDHTPVTSTLQSRRKLANSLLWLAIVFVVCWLPHVICLLYEETAGDPPAPLILQRSLLLLGHIHSALSPIMYWSLNHQWLHGPCTRRRSRHRHRYRFRLPPALGLYHSASSTNEAALGPFNPRLVRPPPQRRRSSHFFY